MSVFENLNKINVNDKVEKKNGLTYLSWAWAWAEVKKRYPDAHYEVIKDANGLPYFSDDRIGIMVYTNVTIEGITHEMWLPVMDSNNKAMKFEPYEIVTKYSTAQVKAATMFDVNKTIMRCLTKNLAMFGLGLYIYAGEDLPEEDVTLNAQKAPDAPQEHPKADAPANIQINLAPKLTEEELQKLQQNCKYVYDEGWAAKLAEMMEKYNVNALEEITVPMAEAMKVIMKKDMKAKKGAA